MARKSRAQTASPSGEHVALAAAAQLARTQLIADRPRNDQGAPPGDLLDSVAQALTRTAVLHVIDERSGETRELGAAELEGALVERGATRLVLKDGRALSGVSVRRAELSQAIARLRSAGLPGLGLPQPPAAPEKAQPDGNEAALRARFAELETLLTLPLLAEQVDRAKAGAVWIARHAPQGRVANLAMQLMSALHETTGSDETPGGFRMALARLRGALEETPPPSSGRS